MKTPDSSSNCAGCVLGSRRSFFGRLSGLVAALAVSEEWAHALGTGVVGEAAGERVGQATLSYPVPAADGVSIDKNEQIILVRFHQKVYAFPLACPHENTALRWRQGDQRFQCARHGSRYTPDGTFISGRATRNMDRYAVSRNGSSVVVDLTKLFQSDTHAAEWGAAGLGV